MNCILIVGASGYVGRAVVQACSAAGLDLATVSGVRARNLDPLREAMACISMHRNVVAVVNCCGYVGKPNVDACECNRKACIDANAVLPVELAQFCAEHGVDLVHISSGCLYSGHPEGGYTELDAPNFTSSLYSQTKADAEARLSNFDRVWILRLRMPVDSNFYPGSRNTLAKIASYPLVVEAKNSITYLPEFGHAVTEIVRRRLEYGIWNLVQPEPVSNSEIVEALVTHGLCPAPRYIDMAQFEAMTVARRSFCTLSAAKANAHGLMTMTGQECLLQALDHPSRIC